MPKKTFWGILLVITSLVFALTSCSVISNIVPKNIATVESIQYRLAFSGDGVVVNLKPSSGAVANRLYTVDLYESGRYRATQSVSWNASELQIYTIKPIMFILPDTELEALPGNIDDASSVFSVKIHEPSVTTQASQISSNPIITITHPKGSEVWHVGQTVTITWETANVPNGTSVVIEFNLPNVNQPLAINGVNFQVVPNTGSYTWKVPESIFGHSTIGNKEWINISCVNSSTGGSIGVNCSSGFFSITN